MRPGVIQTTPLTLNEVRPDRVSQKTFARETEKLFAIMPTTMHPPLLLIDAYEERAQRLARILTLANYRPYVAKTPLEAFSAQNPTWGEGHERYVEGFYG